MNQCSFLFLYYLFFIKYFFLNTIRNVPLQINKKSNGIIGVLSPVSTAEFLLSGMRLLLVLLLLLLLLVSLSVPSGVRFSVESFFVNPSIAFFKPLICCWSCSTVSFSLLKSVSAFVISFFRAATESSVY